MIYNKMQFCFSLFFLLKKFNLLICSREIWIQFKEKYGLEQNIALSSQLDFVVKTQVYHSAEDQDSHLGGLFCRYRGTIRKNLDMHTFILKFRHWNTSLRHFKSYFISVFDTTFFHLTFYPR